MGLKKYILFSLVLIIAIYLYAVSLQLGEYTFNQFSLELSLPIALWLILPIGLLLVFTILHILFYGFKSFLNIRAFQRDEENLLECIKDNFLENNNNKAFKTKGLKDIAKILSQMNLVSKTDSFDSSNDDIKKIILRINEIQEGNYVEDRSIKFNKNGNVANLNLVNKINSKIDFAMDVLKKPSNYSKANIKIAFLNVIKEKSMTTIKKLLESLTLDKEMLLELIKKDSLSDQFSISTEDLVKFIAKAEFTKDDYIDVAKMYRKSTNPDELIKMYETLSSDNEDATTAYLYVLFEFEMLDTIREILNASAANEYTAYRALIDLKDNGRNYTVDSLCYK